MQHRNTIIGAAVVIALIALLGLVGNMDYQDEIAEADLYCKNVHELIWPDYKGIYEKECEDGRHYLAEK